MNKKPEGFVPSGFFSFVSSSSEYYLPRAAPGNLGGSRAPLKIGYGA